MLKKEGDHRGRADGGGAVEGVLAALIPDTGGDGCVVGEELPGEVEVVLGRDEVEDILAAVV